MRVASWAAAWLFLGVRVAAAFPLDTDAACWGRGGLSAFGRVEISPGSPGQAGWGVGLDLAELYAGTGIRLGSARLQGVAGGALWGVRVAQLRTPVGHATAVAVGAQARRGGLTLGVGGECTTLALAGAPTRWHFAPRAGAGWSGIGRLRAVCVVEEGAVADGVRLTWGCELALGPHWRGAVQRAREPGVADGLHLGLETGKPGWVWRAGFDTTTQACTLGFGWEGERQRFAWAARSHPELGWSHVWTYARP